MAKDNDGEDKPKKKAPPRLIVDLGNGEWIDAKFLSRFRCFERYDDKTNKLRYGIMINENAPEFFSIKDYEVMYDSMEERDNNIKRFKEKLSLLNIVII